MDNYEKLYQNYNDEKLKNILAEAYKYTEGALLAAKNECSRRGINHEEIIKIEPKSRAKNNILLQKIKTTILEYTPSIESRKGIKSFDIIDSEQIRKVNSQSAERLFKKLIGTFIIICIYNFVMYFSLFWFTVTDPQADWDFETAFILIPMFTLPLFTLFFFFRRKIGWVGILFQFILASISNVFISIVSVVYFFEYLNTYSNYGNSSILLFFVSLGLSVVIIPYVTFLVSKRMIRSTIFIISDNQYFQSLFASVVFGGLLFYIFYQLSFGSEYVY